MIPVLSQDNMKRSDARECSEGAGGRELMRRAGEGIFAAANWKAPVAILCGGGNNAGDGYVLALCMKRAGIPCSLLRLGDRFSADGQHYYEQCLQAGIPDALYTEQTDLCAFGSIADCIFGTGFHGAPRGLAAHAINGINQSGAYVVSADINSGMDADSGQAVLAVKSDLTVSVGGWKTGHFLGQAKDLMKEKCNIDIGIAPIEAPYQLFEDSDLLPLFAARKNAAHKGSYGYVALVGGSIRYGGAVRLAELANSCMRAGAGVTLLAAPKTLAGEIRPLILESTLYPLSDDGEGSYRFCERELAELAARVNTAAVGMGFGVSEDTKQAVAWLLAHFAGTLILDADALTCLSQLDAALLKQSKASVILTPHIKEFSRLCGESIETISQSPISTAQRWAKANGCVLLLKGATTIVTDGERVYLSDSGCAGMATAGSGDVLSGVMAAVCGAHGNDPLLAAAAATHLTGRAGERAQRKYSAPAMVASDTANALRDTLAALLGCTAENNTLTLYTPSYADLWFRQLMLADQATMAYNRAWGGTVEFGKDRWQAWYSRWLQCEEGSRYYRYVCCGGMPVGEIAYRYDGERGIYIANVLIYAPYRGRGCGKQALSLLCEAARQNGIAALYDDISADNPAVSLFLRCGFTEVWRNEQVVMVKKQLREA